MELGVQGLNSLARFDATLPLARLAEELGYGSWWAQDHVVLPTAGSPLDPTTPIVDPLVHLAHVAAVTSRMTLGTAVIILPQRNPLVLAKQAASLDVLSGGRFVLGIGAGWLAAEMAAVGVPAPGRGGRTDEYLDAMTALWTQPAPEFHGRHVDFAEVDAHPRPTGLRVVVGGRSAGAYRRAVSRAHGFYGNGTPAEIAGDLDGLRRAANEGGPAGAAGRTRDHGDAARAGRRGRGAALRRAGRGPAGPAARGLGAGSVGRPRRDGPLPGAPRDARAVMSGRPPS
jgi:probable F420-dependent oxidoreductase